MALRRSELTNFSKNVVHLMRERGFSVRKTAAQIGISNSTLQDWRVGAIPRDLPAVKRLADLCEVTFEDLLLNDLTVCAFQRGNHGEGAI